MSLVFKQYAEIYDAIYASKDYIAESAYVAELLGGLKNKQLSDVGCGTGKYSEIFAEDAAFVLGIDLSEDMISIANTRKSLLPSHIQSSLQYLVGDARNYQSNRLFDVVCSMFHVINYQTSNDDLRSFFKTAHSLLGSNGQLVFDFWYGPGVLADKPKKRVLEITTDSMEITRTATPSLRLNDNCVDVTYDVQVNKRRNEVVAEKYSETHSMRYLFVPELEFFSDGKFEIERVYAWKTHLEPNETHWSATCVMRKI